MLLIKFLLLLAVFGFLACAIGMVAYDIHLAFELSRILGRGQRQAKP